MKTLVITGASKGIGFATARRFADAEYRVINISRSPAPDERVENHRVDLSLPDAESRLAELLDETLQREEICLVHNAGRLDNDSVDTTPTEAFEEVMRINVTAPHFINQIVMPKMNPGSSVIYIGSTLSEKAVPGTYSYIVSKHAVVGMMRATCQDLAGRDIHTACICPGFTDTEMLRKHVGESEDVLRQIAATSTFGRLLAPDEIASAIWFAAGNPALNGAVIHANLGQVEH